MLLSSMRRKYNCEIFNTRFSNLFFEISRLEVFFEKQASQQLFQEFQECLGFLESAMEILSPTPEKAADDARMRKGKI